MTGVDAVPKKILGHGVISTKVATPYPFPQREFQAMHLPFGSHRKNSLAVYNGTRPRTVVVSVPVFKSGRVSKLPPARPCIRVETFDDLLVPHSMHQHEVPGGNSR